MSDKCKDMFQPALSQCLVLRLEIEHSCCHLAVEVRLSPVGACVGVCGVSPPFHLLWEHGATYMGEPFLAPISSARGVAPILSYPACGAVPLLPFIGSRRPTRNLLGFGQPGIACWALDNNPTSAFGNLWPVVLSRLVYS